MILKTMKNIQWLQIYPVHNVIPMWKFIFQRIKRIITPPLIRCDVCGHDMENVEGSMRCKYCQYFYDMNKEWIDFVHKRSTIIKKEEEDDGR